jgi:hypothetical protein
MVYMASPYSSDDPKVRQARFEAACRAAAKLNAIGWHVFSPVVHSHPQCGSDITWDDQSWNALGLDILRQSSAVWVLAMPGWEESKGVADEIALAAVMQLPLRLLDPVTLTTGPLPKSALPQRGNKEGTQ